MVTSKLGIAYINVEKTPSGTDIKLDVVSPTSGWTNIVIVPAIYISPPQDGIQEFTLTGNPPVDPVVLPATFVIPILHVLPDIAWLLGVRILDESKNCLAELWVARLKEEPIGEAVTGIDNAQLLDDKLKFTACYSGSNEQHGFQLSWDGDVIKTNPPQVYLDLTHADNGDTGRALLEKSLTFALATILEAPSRYIINLRSGEKIVVAHHP